MDRGTLAILIVTSWASPILIVGMAAAEAIWKFTCPKAIGIALGGLTLATNLLMIRWLLNEPYAAKPGEYPDSSVNVWIHLGFALLGLLLIVVPIFKTGSQQSNRAG